MTNKNWTGDPNIATAQSFSGDFKSKAHQLNGPYFHGPVSFFAPDDTVGRRSKHTQSTEGSEPLTCFHDGFDKTQDSGQKKTLS